MTEQLKPCVQEQEIACSSCGLTMEQSRRLSAPVEQAAPVTVPNGYAIVPLRPNRAMEDVMETEGWQWDDLLAAADAIAEEQYNDLTAAPAALSADAQDTKRLDWIQAKGYELSSDHDEDAPWVVHRVSGSPNDREWHEVGRGETVRAAIDAAAITDQEGRRKECVT